MGFNIGIGLGLGISDGNRRNKLAFLGSILSPGDTGSNPTEIQVAAAGSVLAEAFPIAASVDWGDGSAPTTATLTSNADLPWQPTHQYAYTVGIEVTSTADSGPGTLRAAIALANAGTPANPLIWFSPIVFATPQTITLTSGQLHVTASCGIIAPAAGVVISGGGNYRCIEIDGSSSGVVVNLWNLTLTDGNGVGGDYFNDRGSALLIWSEGVVATVTIYQCLIMNSTSTSGGIYIDSMNGGGTAVVSIVNTTITGNSAELGAAITADNRSGDGSVTLTISDCTIVGNTGGAAIMNLGTPSSTIVGSILSGNTSSDPELPDWEWGGSGTSGGYNLYGANGANGGFDFATGTDIQLAGAIDTAVNSLASNGGPTQTLSLPGGSQAIAAGGSVGDIKNDQRNYLRPTSVSIGAFEPNAIPASSVYTFPYTITPVLTPTAPYTATVTPPTLSVTPLQPPPTSPAATPISATEIDLTWTDPVWGSPALADVIVERSASPTSGFAAVGSAPAGTQAYNDTTLSGNTVYYYRFRGFDGTSYYGAYSTTVNALTYPAAPSAPAVPGYSTTQVAVAVPTVAGSTFNLYVDSTLAVTTVTNGYLYTPADNNEHSYTLTQVNASGESNPSSPTSGAVLPDPPTNLTIIGQTQTTLTWSYTDSDSPIDAGYVQQSGPTNPPTATPSVLSANPSDLNGLQPDNVGLQPDNVYYIRAATIDSLGQQGPWSDVVSGTTDTLLVVDCPPQSDTAGTVIFSATVSGGSGTYASATIDPGDGSGPQNASVVGNTIGLTYAYSLDGSYTYTVVVTDSDGNTLNSGTGPVTVSGI